MSGVGRANAGARALRVALLAALCLGGAPGRAAPAAGARYPAAAPADDAVAQPGVPDPRLAWQEWTLNCQGCHRPDGGGSPTTAPQLAGEVAKFLQVPGGREYLARIPGIASSPLSDQDLSAVVNWMLWRFDRQDVPKDFAPYTAAELGRWRVHPLRLEAATVRRRLRARIAASRGAVPAARR